MPDVYDDEKTKSPDDLGVHPEHKEAEADYWQKKFDSPDAIKEAEESAASPDSTALPAAEKDLIGAGYNSEDSNDKRWIRLTSRQKKFGGGVGIAIGIAMTAFSVLHGPMQVIQFAKLLHKFHFINDESLMNSRAGNLIRYRATANNTNLRNLGFFGNILANRYDNKLLRSGINTEIENRRIKRIIIDTSTPEGRKALDNLRASGFEPPPSSGSKVTIELTDTSARTRRRAIKGIVDTLEINGVSSLISARLLRVRGGVDFHPFKNIVRAADESLIDYRTRVKQERIKSLANGVDATQRTTTAEEADLNSDDVVDSVEQAETEGRNAIAAESTDITSIAADKNISSEIKASRIKSKLTRGVGIAGFVTLACGLQQMGDLVYDIRDSNITKPMIRTGMNIQSSGSQVQAGIDTNKDEVGALHADLYDEEKGTTWAMDRSIQYELGKELTGPDLPTGSKPGYDRPAFFDALDLFIGRLPGGTVGCAAATSFVGGFILDGAGWALNSTGPIGFALNASTDVALGVAMGVILDDMIRWLAGQQTDLGATGAMLGGIANYGSRLASIDLAITHGGLPLTPLESAQLDTERRFEELNSQKTKPLYARYFDTNEESSLISKVALLQAMRGSELKPDRLTLATVNSLTQVSKNISRAIAPQVNAQSTTYDYGFPEFGYTLEEIENENYEDPYENAEIVEKRLDELNTLYGGPCFGIKVNPATFQIESDSTTKRFDKIAEGCSNRNNTDLTRYRFYLADMTAAKTLACYEGLDENSCGEFGMGGSAAVVQSGSQGSGIVGNPYSEGVSVPCAPGTKELTTTDGYSNGITFKVKLCEISILPSTGQADVPGGAYSTTGATGFAIVNSRVSKAWLSLVTDAKSAGINLVAIGSFRSMTHQQAICSANVACSQGDYSLIDKPGYSDHQAGVAIDFAGMDIEGGDSCQTRATADNNPAWIWLKNNAAKYGFKQYSKEAWHWDALPAVDRC